MTAADVLQCEERDQLLDQWTAEFLAEASQTPKGLKVNAFLKLKVTGARADLKLLEDLFLKHVKAHINQQWAKLERPQPTQRYSLAEITEMEVEMMSYLHKLAPQNTHRMRVVHSDSVGVVWEGKAVSPQGEVKDFAAMATPKVMLGALPRWRCPLVTFMLTPEAAIASLTQWERRDAVALQVQR